MNSNFTAVGQMQFNAALRAGRNAALKTMTSDCTITRPGERIFDELAGTYTHSGGTVVYSGKCRIKTVSPVGQRTGNVADREMTITMYEVLLPWSDQYDISVSDYVEVNGKTYQVNNVDDSDDRTAYHVIVVDQDRGDVDWA